MNTVILTWNGTHYVGTDISFVSYVTAANGTDIALKIEITNAVNTNPPVTPITASGDMLVGVSHTGSNLIMLDAATAPTDLNTLIERTDLPIEGLRSVTTVTRMFPHIQGTEPVRISLGAQPYAGAPVQWKGFVDFNPSLDRKIDIRVTGALICWKVESVGTGYWRLTGMDIEYELSGVR